MEFDLNQAEWKELRSEAIALAQESRKLEQICIGATGAVYAWLAVHSDKLNGLALSAWCIPILFAFAGAIRSWAVGKSIKVMSEYLLTIEAKLNEAKPDEPSGWENYFDERRGHVHGSAVAVWIVFIVVTVAVPCLIAKCT